ncbi:potassium channel family protein [Pseudomonas knackmussii]|uniref:potassium channel family protein n=1 Tax=Pseudomonas knackmussii TaxID=65741 RepID=UPI00191C0949|nr:potassium channel family protein [Pseudomonas knackmussii]
MPGFLHRFRFRLLFFSSVFMLLVLGFPQPPLALDQIALLTLVLSGINSLPQRRGWIILAALFGSACVVFSLLAELNGHSPYFDRTLPLLAFYAVLLVTLFRRVARERPVTGELLYGLSALYLQLALAYALLYALIQRYLPGGFGPPGSELHLDSFVYFSLITLTTVGYGDIQPLLPITRLLATSEAVLGVLFISVAVARGLSLINEPTD